MGDAAFEFELPAIKLLRVNRSADLPVVGYYFGWLAQVDLFAACLALGKPAHGHIGIGFAWRGHSGTWALEH